MFPAKNLHHSPQTTQNKEDKNRVFLCALNKKIRLTAQRTQNSKFQFSFFTSGVISFTIFQTFLLSFTLKSFIYLLHLWERKQPLRGVTCN